MLQNRAINLLGEAHDRFEAFRKGVRSELLRRVSPFLHSRNLNGRFPDEILLPLSKANTWLQGMAGHLDGLKTDPVEASLLICNKAQALFGECDTVESSLGIKTPSASQSAP